MTIETQERETVKITPCMQEIIEHMLANPRGRYCTADVSVALGRATGTISPLLRRMLAAGWVTAETDKRVATYPRIWYRFTPGTAPMLRKAIR